ncbi:MAG: hypothetical protein ABIJ26_00060 [Candidatus Margulisiibacteriota bacterium]|nr:hypothetical protein [Candidatus Margulisiibacteriota bacterium]
MKKIVALMLLSVLVFAGSSMAAKRQMAVGFQGLTITTNTVTMPTLLYKFNDSFTGLGGISFVSQGNTSNFTLAFSGRFPLSKGEKVNTHWGAGLTYTSNPALVADSSLLGLCFNVGAEIFFMEDLALDVNIVPLSVWSRSAAGATTTTFAVLNSVAVPSVVIGAHYYIN